jgi:hypothetical protein
VIECRARVGFAGEARQAIRFTGEGVGQNLERDIAMEFRVVERQICQQQFTLADRAGGAQRGRTLDSISTYRPTGAGPFRLDRRAGGHRAPALCGLTGSFIPFAKTKAERTTRGDPRRSLEERYTDRAGLVRAVERAARELVESRFLLPEHADRFVAAAKASDFMQPAGIAPQNR